MLVCVLLLLIACWNGSVNAIKGFVFVILKIKICVMKNVQILTCVRCWQFVFCWCCTCKKSLFLSQKFNIKHAISISVFLYLLQHVFAIPFIIPRLVPIRNIFIHSRIQEKYKETKCRTMCVSCRRFHYHHHRHQQQQHQCHTFFFL